MADSEVVIEVRQEKPRFKGNIGVGFYVDGKRLSGAEVSTVEKARELFMRPGPFFERDFGAKYRLVDKLDEAPPNGRPRAARQKAKRKRRK